MTWSLRNQIGRIAHSAILSACLGLFPGDAVAGDADIATELFEPAVDASVNDDRLTLRAEGAELADVLRAIGKAGSFDVVLSGKFADPVHQSFTGEPLEEAIRKLVGQNSLIIIRGSGALGDSEVGLAEIRVTMKRTWPPSEANDAKLKAVKVLRSEGGAAKVLDKQEAYQAAVLAYTPPTKVTLLFDLNDTDPVERMAAVTKVSSIPAGEAFEILSYVLSNDDDMNVRSRAVAALTRFDGPGSHGLLRERALTDDDPVLRMQAANALATASGERSVNVLGRAIRQDPEREVRMNAIRALGRIGGDWAQRFLKRAARDRDPAVRETASQVLATLPE